jgi:hypothetical protein
MHAAHLQENDDFLICSLAFCLHWILYLGSVFSMLGHLLAVNFLHWCVLLRAL